MAQYFLDQNMRVIFGHDWRENGVMRAIANFAESVAALNDDGSDLDSTKTEIGKARTPRMLNLVPTNIDHTSKVALEAQRNSGGVLEIIPVSDKLLDLSEWHNLSRRWFIESKIKGEEAVKYTVLRHYLTEYLDPGCRICLGGRRSGYNGRVPGVQEEAEFALLYKKPLYLMGGFGGASQMVGELNDLGIDYWSQNNGLNKSEKNELFQTTDVEYALRLVSSGIRELV